MTPTAAIHASIGLLARLADPASRALALACVAGLALAAFRVKATSVRLFAWKAVLYAAIAMPSLGWMLPSVSVSMPPFFQHRASQPQLLPEHVRIFQPFSATAPTQTATQVFVPLNKSLKGTSADKIALAGSSQTLVSQRVRLFEETPLAAAEPSAHQILNWDSISWKAVAGVIYLTGAILLLARFFVGIAFGRRLMRAARILDDPRVAIRLASPAYAADLAIIPRTAESDLISVPVTMGALRSTILLPADWREWCDAKLDAVVAHEMSHVARRDALTQRLTLLYRAIFWFSPLAWWLERHLAGLAEQASDEAALSCGADRTDYAKTLLGFFEALEAAPGRVWWQGVSMAKAGQAEQRLDRILAWKGVVTMSLKKSIVAGVVALALPVVYLAASVHPAKYNVAERGMNLAQDQATPPPPPRPAPAPRALPDAKPVLAPLPSPPDTPEAAPLPQAAIGEGGIVGPHAMPRVPGAAPVAAIAPRVAMISPAPIRGVVAPAALAYAPRAWGYGQSRSTSSSSGSSSSQGNSYSYGYDDDQRFVIVTGKSDSLTMSGSVGDARHVQELRKKIQGDFIWFQHDEKSYIIRDPAVIETAKKLWEPQEELGKKQEELGKQQEALGAQQEALGKKMEGVRVSVPDMTADIEKLKAELKQLSGGGTQEQLGNLQSEIGELQSKLGDLQSQAGDQQGKLGEEMGKLGEEQGKLGEQQGKLGEEQGELARKASKQMAEIFEQAIKSGVAQPE